MIFKKNKSKKTIIDLDKLPPYATEEDFVRCREIVRQELDNKDIIVTDDVLEKITLDIMGISYGKGGGYSYATFPGYARPYIAYGFYKEFTEKKE